jgi:hypothetical protein
VATDLENLQARRSAILAELAVLDSTKAGGQPDSPAGIGHVAYKDGLYRELEAIDKRIAAAEGPWEVITQMTPG